MEQNKIIWARYGAREYGQWADVTEKVRNLTENTLIDEVNFGPVVGAEGKAKSLWMLRADGSVRTITEGAYLTPPENWEELLYATRKPRSLVSSAGVDSDNSLSGNREPASASSSLTIYQANYGLRDYEGDFIDVTQHLQSLVKNNSLDIIVNNSTLTPGQNPFRGKKKRLHLVYSIDGTERVERIVEEKDWLIIGPLADRAENTARLAINQAYEYVEANKEGLACIGGTLSSEETGTILSKRDGKEDDIRPRDIEIPNLWPKSISHPPLTATALNDYLIRKFSVSPQRLRGPMPIEVPQFHRNDLAQLFAELGFKRGAEIGVAEGNYSEVLLKANPTMELLCVDPWHSYSDNPQNKTKEKNEYAYNEAKRKLCQPDWHVKLIPLYSMDAVRDVEDDSLDFVYIDGHHSFDYVMQDIIEWSKRVRSGGIVSGDDLMFLDEKRWGAGPVEAVQAYTKAHRIPIWWLFAGHKSVDYFWVKP